MKFQSNHQNKITVQAGHKCGSEEVRWHFDVIHWLIIFNACNLHNLIQASPMISFIASAFWIPLGHEQEGSIYFHSPRLQCPFLPQLLPSSTMKMTSLALFQLTKKKHIERTKSILKIIKIADNKSGLEYNIKRTLIRCHTKF